MAAGVGHPLHLQASYLESLLMTRMRAPFSSFSLWLSDFSSVKICGETRTRWSYSPMFPAPVMPPGSYKLGAGCAGAEREPGRNHF